MSDVMTTEERIAYDRALKFNQDERVPQPFDGDVAMMHDTIDRLVAEVASLRARNEALEKVVKSVALVAHFGGLIDLSTDGALNMVRRLTIGHFDKSSPPEELRLALAALNPSETPNSSGGDPCATGK